MPKLYIDEFVGITNRLETLPLAFAIRKEYGHEIILDWHELDAFTVEDTRRGKVRVAARVGAVRVRSCDDEIFGGLKDKKIILRSLDGPPQKLDPIYLEVASKIHLDAKLAREVRETFTAVHGRPTIGVHIRHGDYILTNGDTYDATTVEWPAVPVWWYERTMGSIVEQQKDACFFLSCTGDPAVHAPLYRNFDVITLERKSPYHYKGPAHESSVHPVADLFALACCPVMLATPLSGYSHWAANALGKPTTCIVPLSGATRSNPHRGFLMLHGKRLPRWRAAGRNGTDVVPMPRGFKGIDLSQSANTTWL